MTNNKSAHASSIQIAATYMAFATAPFAIALGISSIVSPAFEQFIIAGSPRPCVLCYLDSHANGSGEWHRSFFIYKQK